MKQLFIHHPLFRLFSPLFSGVIVYLLLLLIHNDVEQLQDYFLGQELYLCIVMSYIIQECSRLVIKSFKKLSGTTLNIKKLAIQLAVLIVICIALTSSFIILYYKYVEGFMPNSEELIIFNSIFCGISLVYILLHLSHQYLHEVYQQKLTKEAQLKQLIEDDFNQFKKGINPELLFESLETLIDLIRNNSDTTTDDFLDQLSAVYRYILSKRKEQLVSISEELSAVNHLTHLFNYLPYRNIKLNTSLNTGFLVVPGSILSVVELIIKNSINTRDNDIEITIDEIDDYLNISYIFNDKINQKLTLHQLNNIQEVYTIYSNIPIDLTEKDGIRSLTLPKLNMKPKA